MNDFDFWVVGLISETELGAQSVVYELATIAYMVGVKSYLGSKKLYTCTDFRISSDPAEPAVCWSMGQDITVT